MLALLVGGVLGWRWWRQHRAAVARQQAREAATGVATAFLQAWEAGDRERMSALATADAGARIGGAMDRLRVTDRTLEPGPVSLRDRERPQQGATVPFEATFRLRGLGTWSYEGRIPTVPPGQGGRERWRVDFSPRVLHPALADGGRLERTRDWPERAPILAADGEPIEPGATQLAGIVGRLGEADARRAGRLGAPYREGDTVGVGGLQLLYEQRLAGSPSGTVRAAGGGREPEVLERFPGRAPEPLTTGLDPRVQRAAEAAMADAPGAGAMVVLAADSKAVRAVVNTPPGFNRALAGQYAPGSTFKVVTTIGLLRHGITPATSTDCPAATTIQGREFTNYQDAAYGTIPFRQAFYLSCNTAFVQLAADLPEGALAAAARAVGFTADDPGPDADWSLGLADPYHGFPTPPDVATRAAAAFGQAAVAASPVTMAGVAAAVAGGGWDNPWLAAPQRDQAEPVDLGGVAPTVRGLMREVPRRGTAAGAGLPDGVGGKTGTAEVGQGGELVNNTWFIGFDDRGDREPLAWAVLVENGTSGGSTAAPLAAKLLARLGRG